MGDNRLYYGDNLDVLRRHVPDSSVDLVYLDPPFNSNQDYNVLFERRDGGRASAQIQAFEDTWRWDMSAAHALDEVVLAGGPVANAMMSLQRLLGESDMLAYLAMMAPRLVELRRVLKDTGSLYLHCDPTAGHYLKVLMDSIFGPDHFLADITWRRSPTHSDAKRWSPVADTILHYSKGNTPTWNPQYAPHDEKYIAAKYRHDDGDGRVYRLDNMTSPKPRPNMMYEWKGHASPPNGWRYSTETMARLDEEGRIWYPDSKAKRPQLKRYLDDMSGVLLSNVWTDINPINSRAAERLGYPTQKPIALLERIVKGSSNPGDVVLDPFCGCGTTVAAAQRLKRRWIGIDITHLAVNLMKHRLLDMFGPSIVDEYEVRGEPTTAEGARELAETEPYQFQFWALGLVGARPVDEKKGADKGVDGRIFFRNPEGRGFEQIILSVKAGKQKVTYLRDLRGVIDRENAPIGVLISMEEPTGPMRQEAASAGFYRSPWGQHPRLQLLTVEQLMSGARIDYPRQGDVSYRRAPREEKKVAEQLRLGDDPT